MGRLEREEGDGAGRGQAEVHRSGQSAEGQAWSSVIVLFNGMKIQ